MVRFAHTSCPYSLGCFFLVYTFVYVESIRQDGVNIKPVRRPKYFYSSYFSIFCRVEIDALCDFDYPVWFLVAKTQIQSINFIVVMNFHIVALFLSG